MTRTKKVNKDQRTDIVNKDRNTAQKVGGQTDSKLSLKILWLWLYINTNIVWADVGPYNVVAAVEITERLKLGKMQRRANRIEKINSLMVQ